MLTYHSLPDEICLVPTMFGHGRADLMVLPTTSKGFFPIIVIYTWGMVFLPSLFMMKG